LMNNKSFIEKRQTLYKKSIDESRGFIYYDNLENKSGISNSLMEN
jgi:hypothetical protein